MSAASVKPGKPFHLRMNGMRSDENDPGDAEILGRNRFPDVIRGSRPEAVESESRAKLPGSGRAYWTVFGRMWVHALAAARAMPRWTVQHTDPANGEIEVEVRPLLRGSSRRLAISIGLDDLGLTRVNASFLTASGDPLPSRGERQIERFFRHVERLVSTEEEQGEKGEG